MRKEKIKKENGKVKFIALTMIATLTLGATGFTMAYFTDHHSKVNKFTIGQVKTELTEKKWDETGSKKATGLLPNMDVEKDPVIKNTGKSDSYNFISFRVPYGKFAALGTFAPKTINGKTVSGQCTSMDVAAAEGVDVSEKDLFSFNPAAANWILVENKTGSDFHEYTFAYATGENSKTGVMKALKSGESTTQLFNADKVKAINLVEDEWALQNSCLATEGKTFNIPVRTYSIQTTDLEDLKGTDKTDPESVWAIVKAQVETKYKGMAESGWGITSGDDKGKGDDAIVSTPEAKHDNRKAVNAKVM